MFAKNQPILIASSDNNYLTTKSHDLFEKRGVLQLARNLLTSDAYAEWMRSALSLQRSIYGLDVYYEQSVALRSVDELPLWDRVEGELRSERRSHDDLLWSSFADLKLYADVETRIHEFDLIDPREFANIVGLKCSDVRMARGLIWTFSGHPNPKVIRYWEIYDQCWELIEDVLDIGEDGTDWNFNFWLYSFMAGQDVVAGFTSACSTLCRKVNELTMAYHLVPLHLSRSLAPSYTMTTVAATAARRGWRTAFAAISRGKVWRYVDQIEWVAEVA